MKHTNKKGQIMQNIGVLGIGVATLVIILAVTFLIMSQLQKQTVTMDAACATNNSLHYNSTNNFCCYEQDCTSAQLPNATSHTEGQLSNAMNSTQNLTSAAATIPGWVPLVILVAIGGIILGLVSAFRKR